MITVLSLSPCVDKVYFVEDFRPGGLYRVENIVKSAGGKGINVARVCTLLGEEVNCLGFKAGSTGDWIEEELREIKVDTTFVSVPGESRTNNNIIDRKNGTETEVLEIGPCICENNKKQFEAAFINSLDKTEVLVCSGGLPKGMPINYYRQLITLARNKGIKTILDSNGEMLAEGILAAPDLIKPNLRELRVLTGKRLDTIEEIIDSCRNLIESGIKQVIVSMGQDGAMLITSNKVLKAEVPQIEAINTIGSGDSSVAGCAAAMMRGYSEEEMLSLSMACAVANTQFMEIGVVTTELIDMYLPQIKIGQV